MQPWAEETHAGHLKAAAAKQIGIHVPGPFTSTCTSLPAHVCVRTLDTVCHVGVAAALLHRWV